jgi:hypothetical protein
MAFDPVRDVTVLVGGVPSTGAPQTWEWDGSGFLPGSLPQGTWATSAQLHGGNRSYFAMGFDPVSQRTIAHGGLGGTGGTQTLSSTYAWDGSTWALLAEGSPGVVSIACGQAVAGEDLSATGSWGDIDFNNDGFFPDFLDIESYMSVDSGGPCL